MAQLTFGMTIKQAKREARKQDELSIPRAVEIWQSVRKVYPRHETWAMIKDGVGHAEEDLKLWEQILIEWVAMGWNPNAVRGPLEFFKRKEIPTAQAKTSKSRNKDYDQYWYQRGGLTRLQRSEQNKQATRQYDDYWEQKRIAKRRAQGLEP